MSHPPPYWQPYTGAVDIRNRTRKHPFKDVIHCASYMQISTEAQPNNIDTQQGLTCPFVSNTESKLTDQSKKFNGEYEIVYVVLR